MTARVLPRHRAEAIAELGAEQALAAKRRLDRWRNLESAGVPAHDVRHLLDRRWEQTHSLGVVERWHRDGAPGFLVLVGARGIGKSFAAAWWLDACARRHDHGRWLACSSWARRGFDSLREELDAATRASVLVIDDLGAGATGKRKLDGSQTLSQEWLNGLLLERWGMNRPTLLLVNGEREDLASWLDARLLSRIAEGGDIVEVAGASMRETDSEIRHLTGTRGRGRSWQHATDLIETLGVSWEPRPTGEHRDGPTEHAWAVGGRLIEVASDVENRKAQRLLGLGDEHVMARAQQIADADRGPELAAALSSALDQLARAMGADSRHAADAILASTASARRRADNLRRADQCYAAMNTPLGGTTGRKEDWPSLPTEPPAWARCEPQCSHRACDAKRRLKLAGFEVKPHGNLPRYVVSFGGRQAWGLVDTPYQGWAVAARLAAMNGCATVLHVGELAG